MTTRPLAQVERPIKQHCLATALSPPHPNKAHLRPSVPLQQRHGLLLQVQGVVGEESQPYDSALIEAVSR